MTITIIMGLTKPSWRVLHMSKRIENNFGHWHEIKHLVGLTGGATPSCSCSKKSPAHCFVSITKYTCVNKGKGVSERKLLFCPTHLRELKLTRARRP